MTLVGPRRSTLSSTSALARVLLGAGLAALVSACSSSIPYTTVPAAPGSDVPLDQPSRGAEIYAQNCAGCHGDNGEGNEGHAALIGPKALPIEPPAGAKIRKGKLTNAQDLFAFVKSDMPPLAPGSLDDADTWALVAHLVKENGADLHGKELDARAAASLALHR
jgi:mono/diheme cytochrome c family protein